MSIKVLLVAITLIGAESDQSAEGSAELVPSKEEVSDKISDHPRGEGPKGKRPRFAPHVPKKEDGEEEPRKPRKGGEIKRKLEREDGEELRKLKEDGLRRPRAVIPKAIRRRYDDSQED